MNLNDRNNLMSDLYLEARQTADKKGRAYATNDDALGNFKEVALRTGLTPFQTWLVFFDKHYTAISNAIKQNPAAPVERTESLHGRIIDMIVYLGILEALDKEARQVDKAEVAAPVDDALTRDSIEAVGKLFELMHEAGYNPTVPGDIPDEVKMLVQANRKLREDLSPKVDLPL